MTSRPFYRSLLFWLGVPGFAFLVWVWWDSSVEGTFMGWRHGKREETVAVARGKARWEGMVYHRVSGFAADFYYHRASAVPPWVKGAKREFLMPRAFVWGRNDDVEKDGTMSSRSLEVALWVIPAGYGVVWAGILWWWQRRKARVVKGEGVPGDQ